MPRRVRGWHLRRLVRVVEDVELDAGYVGELACVRILARKIRGDASELLQADWLAMQRDIEKLREKWRLRLDATRTRERQRWWTGRAG